MVAGASTGWVPTGGLSGFQQPPPPSGKRTVSKTPDNVGIKVQILD